MLLVVAGGPYLGISSVVLSACSLNANFSRVLPQQKRCTFKIENWERH